MKFISLLIAVLFVSSCATRDMSMVTKEIYLEGGALCASDMFYLAESYKGNNDVVREDGTSFRRTVEEYLCYKDSDDLKGRELIPFSYFKQLQRDDTRKDVYLLFLPRGYGTGMKHIYNGR